MRFLSLSAHIYLTVNKLYFLGEEWENKLCKENIPAFLSPREELMVWMELFSSPRAQNPNHDMGEIEKHPLGTFRGQTCTKNPSKRKGQQGLESCPLGKGAEICA